MKRKSIKILLLVTGISVIFLLLLPGFVKRYAINHSKEIIGRQIHIDKLKYNYFTSTIKVYDFKMLEENEQDNFITFDTLIVNIEPLALIKDKIEIEAFYLKGLDVKVIMKDSTFNFDDLVAFHATEEDSITQNTEEEVKRLYLVAFFNSSLGKIFISKYSRQGVQTNLSLTEIGNLSIPIIDYKKQQQIANLIEESFALKKQSEHLLEVAKRAVEIAIEESEAIALKYINQETK